MSDSELSTNVITVIPGGTLHMKTPLIFPIKLHNFCADDQRVPRWHLRSSLCFIIQACSTPQHERYLQCRVQVSICIAMVTCDAVTDMSVEEIYQNAPIKVLI